MISLIKLIEEGCVVAIGVLVSGVLSLEGAIVRLGCLGVDHSGAVLLALIAVPRLAVPTPNGASADWPPHRSAHCGAASALLVLLWSCSSGCSESLILLIMFYLSSCLGLSRKVKLESPRRHL